MIQPWLLALALIVASGLASAQPSRNHISRAHMEACVRWEKLDGRIGTRNSCDTPVTILFMAFGNPRVVEANVVPAGWFDPGVSDATDGFMFTVCPVGYAPSMRFSMENAEPIIVSLYNCLPGRPNA